MLREKPQQGSACRQDMCCGVHMDVLAVEESTVSPNPECQQDTCIIIAPFTERTARLPELRARKYGGRAQTWNTGLQFLVLVLLPDFQTRSSQWGHPRVGGSLCLHHGGWGCL